MSDAKTIKRHGRMEQRIARIDALLERKSTDKVRRAALKEEREERVLEHKMLTLKIKRQSGG